MTLLISKRLCINVMFRPPHTFIHALIKYIYSKVKGKSNDALAMFLVDALHNVNNQMNEAVDNK